MNYMVSRDGQEYGPYTLSDLQRYVASGEILLSDLTRSEGMTDYMPVGQVIGTIAVPPVGTHVSLAPAGPVYPDPPNLHWGLVLLFAVLTCGLFLGGWGIALAMWARKLEPKSKAIIYYGIYAASLVCIFFVSMLAAMQHTTYPAQSLINIVGAIFAISGRFSLKNTLERHYNSEEPMGVELNGVLVFFFAEIYIQYQLNNIVRRKQIDRMDAVSI